jgi:hypothetical protein
MGQKTFDQFSLLHVASGIIAYFWGLPLLWWLIIHIVFEYVENTKMGMHFINQYLPMWPGGKATPDTFMNSMIGDNISAVVGWLIAAWVDKGRFSLEKRTGNTKFNSLKN